MGIQDVLRECLQGTKVNFSTLIKDRVVGAPPLRIGVDLSVYAHQGIRAQSIGGVTCASRSCTKVSWHIRC